MPRTKAQRKRLYRGMLEKMMSKMILHNSATYRAGLCRLLPGTKNLVDYPELWAQRPKKNQYGLYWFYVDEAGTEKRIQILIAAQIK